MLHRAAQCVVCPIASRFMQNKSQKKSIYNLSVRMLCSAMLHNKKLKSCGLGLKKKKPSPNSPLSSILFVLLFLQHFLVAPLPYLFFKFVFHSM